MVLLKCALIPARVTASISHAVILLLVGGIKRNQQADIDKAKAMVKEL
jgi:hypothetical protein